MKDIDRKGMEAIFYGRVYSRESHSLGNCKNSKGKKEMTTWFKNLIIKFFSSKYTLAMASTVAAWIVGFLQGAPIDLSPEDWSQFVNLSVKIFDGLLNWGIAALIGYDFVVAKFKKPETPKLKN